MIKKIGLWMIVIGAVLSLPWLTNAPWTSGDYLFAAIVLSVLATAYEFVTRNITKTTHRLMVAAVFIGIIFLIIGWAATGPD